MTNDFLYASLIVNDGLRCTGCQVCWLLDVGGKISDAVSGSKCLKFVVEY